jgi:hypothetical protein
LKLIARINKNLGRPLEIKDVAEFKADVEVDGDNKPAAKSIPNATQQQTTNVLTGHGDTTVCVPGGLVASLIRSHHSK